MPPTGPIIRPALYAYLASLVTHHHLAWDCATGNGQAALGLAEHFERVVATDASSEQISHAFAHERVDYRVQPAEEPDLEAHSVDLVTVATGVHWFDLDRFYAAVRRAAAPNGILAVWTYHLPIIEPAVDAILRRYTLEVLADYWPERWHYLNEYYQTLPFPFDETSAPGFEMQANWNLNHLAGFLNSWSATQRYRTARGQHPVNVIWQELAKAWGPPDQPRAIRWPLYMRVGKITA